jgi:hypothetical protein
MLWSFEPPMILAALTLALVSLAVLMAIWRLKRRLPTALAELGSGV